MNKKSPGKEKYVARLRGVASLVVATVALISTGCVGLQYAKEPPSSGSRWYVLSYPAHEVIISAEGDAATTSSQINCYDDVGCIERLVAFLRSTPVSAAQLFMSPPDGSNFSIAHGPYGLGMRAVGWDADIPHSNGGATVDGAHRWQLKRLTDPSAPTLRLRIQLPIILGLQDQSENCDDASNHSAEVGFGNPALHYCITYGESAPGVITVSDFVERARDLGEGLSEFPAAACRVATITFSATSTDGKKKKFAEVSLPIPDVGHVLPVPLQRGTYILLDPVCGVDVLD